MKKQLITAVIAILILSVPAYAAEAGTSNASNTNFDIDTSHIETTLKEMIISDYAGLYDLSNFEFEYSVREEDNLYIDIDVYADMMLVREPEKSPFIIGMEKRLNEETDVEKQQLLRKEIDRYVSEIESYYLKPIRSTFPYTVVIESNSGLRSLSSSDNVSFFYRTNPSDKVLLTDVNELSEVENQKVALDSGYEAAESFINRQDNLKMNVAKSSFTYDRIAARDWALEKYSKTPEFPSDNVPGTNCANFVSKALNAGGIPEDKDGKWYRAATWGGWPGDNWFRTGYYNNGGVVPYMTDKGYFYLESNESKVFAGSIMYWNSESHVALVTYGDSVTIKFTEQGAQRRKDVVYRTEDASFYMPDSSIM